MNKERPNLEGLVKPETLAIEEFQNTVIRPIIKMQHALLIAQFKFYLQKRKIDFLSLTDKKKKSKITAALQKDLQFKNVILGGILGHFSINEYERYCINTSEFNRRIINITIQRLQDSILEL